MPKQGALAVVVVAIIALVLALALFGVRSPLTLFGF